ncbi:hypothetical protein O988_09094, partial [Pseudogymnoascus sp. VKM F-3808]
MFGYELNLIGVWWVSGRNATGLARDITFVESVIFVEPLRELTLHATAGGDRGWRRNVRHNASCSQLQATDFHIDVLTAMESGVIESSLGDDEAQNNRLDVTTSPNIPSLPNEIIGLILTFLPT